jgi:DNA-binding transcriptional LysR family regulator
METMYLQEFLTVAESANYTEAADQMYVSQSTLFKHIKTMEHELGVPLFEKSGRKIILTQYGRIFMPYAQRIVKEMASCTRELKLSMESELAMVRLGAEYRTHDLVKAFCELNDDYRVKVTGLSARKLLEEKKCDLAILMIGLEPKEEQEALFQMYEHVHLMSETASLLVSQKHPLAQKSTVSMDELKNEGFISIGVGVQDLNYKLCSRAGFEPIISGTVYIGSEAVDMVAQNIGITFLHRKMIDSMFDVEEVGTKWLDLDPPFDMDVSLFWRKDTKLSKAAEKFSLFLQEYYKER